MHKVGYTIAKHVKYTRLVSAEYHLQAASVQLSTGFGMEHVAGRVGKTFQFILSTSKC
jgi:hypothetical protein